MSSTDPVSSSPLPLPESATAAAIKPAFVSGVKYFDIDNRGISLVEYFYESRNPLVWIIAIIIFILRIRIRGGSTDDVAVDRLSAFETDESHVPDLVRLQTLTQVDQLKSLGYVDPVYQLIDDPLQSTQTLLISLRHTDGRSIARAHARIWHHKHPPKVKSFVEFITSLADGRHLWTLSGKPDTKEPATCLLERMANATTFELHARHLARVEAIAPAIGVRMVSDVQSLQDHFDELQSKVVAFHVQRKFFVEPDEQALASVGRSHARRLSGDNLAGSDDGPVLLQIDRMLNGRGSWQSAISLFVISLFVFAIAGGKTWGWTFVAMLVPILFFHELGHYVAMRAFGYRSLRMFFLPLLGAAVSGRSFNVAAWKQVIVALAGPLPGILAGVVFGAVGLIMKIQWLNELSLLTILINAFNLLPMLPLDGGRVAHLLLFRRHPYLDVGFRAITALLLFGIGLMIGDRFLIIFPIVVAISIPMAIRVARVTQEIRRTLPTPISTHDTHGIPPRIASQIISMLKRGTKRPVPTKILATQTLDVFEAISTPSPSWGTTIGLGSLHIVSIGVAVVSTVVLAFVAQRNQLPSLADLRNVYPRALPQQRLDKVVRSSQTSGFDVTAEHCLVAATFSSDSAASKVYDAQLAALGSGSSIGQLGPILLIDLPASESARASDLFDQFEKANAEPYVSREGWASLQLSATFDTVEEAGQASARIGPTSYLGHVAVPPWVEPDQRTPQERQRNERARLLFHGLTAVQRDCFKLTSEQSRDKSKEANDLRRRGKDEEADKLEAKINDDQTTLLKEKIDAFAKGYASPDDLEVIDLWTQTNAFDANPYNEGTDYVAIRKKMAAAQARLNVLIGSWPGESHLPEGAQKVWLGTSNAFDDERLVHVSINQRTPSLAVPKIVDWLKAQGATVSGASLGAGTDWMLKASTRPALDSDAEMD